MEVRVDEGYSNVNSVLITALVHVKVQFRVTSQYTTRMVDCITHSPDIGARLVCGVERRMACAGGQQCHYYLDSW